MGTPPPTRGKSLLAAATAPGAGNTPAYAGKIPAGIETLATYGGTPPPTRGKLAVR